MSKESIDLELLDPEKNPFDIDEWHSLTTGLFIGLGIGSFGGWFSFFAIPLAHLDKESHYFALGFFIGIVAGLPLGAFIGKLLYSILVM